jgi:hypothetical protein
MLRRPAQIGEGMDNTVFADLGGSLNHHMGKQMRAITQLYAGTDDAIGADLYIHAQFGARMDDGRRMNLTH